jgi:hypothetical protein
MRRSGEEPSPSGWSHQMCVGSRGGEGRGGEKCGAVTGHINHHSTAVKGGMVRGGDAKCEGAGLRERSGKALTINRRKTRLTHTHTCSRQDRSGTDGKGDRRLDKYSAQLMRKGLCT